MGYYLLDHPPRSRQFFPSRANTPTWAVSVHTSEGPAGPGAAVNLARFISQRSDPGSYAVVVDSETTVQLVPPDYTTFSVAASGYNSRTYAVCIAGRSADLSSSDPYTIAAVGNAGAVIARLWQSLGIGPDAAAWIGTAALERVGLFCHGDVQPWDRTDAWSIHPDRPALDRLLVDAIRSQYAPTPVPTEEQIMRRFIRAQSSPAVYLTDAGLLSKTHMADEQRLRDAGWALRVSGVPVLDPPPGATVEIIAGEKVWVVGDAFANAIPTV